LRSAGVKSLLKKRSVLVTVYAIYLSMVLLSVQAFLAEESVDEIRNNMDEYYDYSLTFRSDGRTTHYDVTRHDSGENGRIVLRYYTQSNKLVISRVENIKTLKIDVQSMFEDESQRVFKKSHTSIPNMDMDYWLTAGDGIFTIEFNIASGEQLESLKFTKFPEPESVLVNNKEWWQTELNYELAGKEITVTKIPTGKTTVIIDFNKKKFNELPVPSFVTDPEGRAGVNDRISFDAGKSYDPDGKIESYLWSFGDDTTGSGKTVNHTYSKPGKYSVRLTVRDDFVPYGEAWIEKNLTVEYSEADDFDNDGLSDRWEWENFDSLVQGPADDPDGDGYANKLEYLADTDPGNKNDYEEDSDNDGLPDLWEWKYFESLLYGGNEDPDADFAANRAELDAGTDPSDPDSKPASAEPDDGGEGMQGLGKVAGIDTFLLVMLAVILILVVYIAALIKINRAESARREAESAKIKEREQKRDNYMPLYDGELLLVCSACGGYIKPGVGYCPMCGFRVYDQ